MPVDRMQEKDNRNDSPPYGLHTLLTTSIRICLSGSKDQCLVQSIDVACNCLNIYYKNYDKEARLTSVYNSFLIVTAKLLKTLYFYIYFCNNSSSLINKQFYINIIFYYLNYREHILHKRKHLYSRCLNFISFIFYMLTF